MKYHFYLNFLKGKHLHAGVERGGVTTYKRPPREELKSTNIEAFVDIFLNEGVPLTWNEIEQVVDEGMDKIGAPQDDQIYSEKTTHGEFGLLCDKSFPGSAQEIKNILHEQHDEITISDTYLISGKQR